MNFLKEVRAKFLALVALVAPALASAQEQTGSLDLSTEIGQIQTGMTGVINQLKAPAIAIVLAGVAIWVIPKLVGYLKTAFQAGKGR